MTCVGPGLRPVAILGHALTKEDKAPKGAGLSQSELAERIGSKQPVIERLEDADYDGHSLTMLQRIAAALERRWELRFVPRLSVQSRRKLQPA